MDAKDVMTLRLGQWIRVNLSRKDTKASFWVLLNKGSQKALNDNCEMDISESFGLDLKCIFVSIFGNHFFGFHKHVNGYLKVFNTEVFKVLDRTSTARLVLDSGQVEIDCLNNLQCITFAGDIIKKATQEANKSLPKGLSFSLPSIAVEL